jgi:hypothetical protein
LSSSPERPSKAKLIWLSRIVYNGWNWLGVRKVLTTDQTVHNGENCPREQTIHKGWNCPRKIKSSTRAKTWIQVIKLSTADQSVSMG